MNCFRNALTLTLLAALAWTTSVLAEDLKVTSEDGEVLATFDLKSFEALGIEEVETTTPWTDGVNTFEGVSIKKILAEAGVGGRNLTGHSMDDYAANLSAEVIEAFDPIIATRMNGNLMDIENKGPFWIMFDFDDMPPSTSIEIQSLAVWHLNELEVE